MNTHDTFVLGIKDGKIEFIKTFDYIAEYEDAQKALLFVQDKNNFDNWNISHVGQWIFEHTDDLQNRLEINISTP